MMSTRSDSKVILPPKYYLDYFVYLIAFVENQYAHVLDDSDHHFIQSFRALEEDAQCLFVRFSNRRGPLYRASKLDYAEIVDIQKSLTQLLEAGFATVDIPESSEIIHLFTKPELLRHFPDLLRPIKSLPKDVWIDELLTSESAFQKLRETDLIVRVEKQTEFEFLKLLFFGSYKAQMTEFVVRDVGHVNLETLDSDKLRPWCQSRQEAWAFFQISELKSTIRKALKDVEAQSIHEEIKDMDWELFRQYPKATKALGKVCLELATQLEREKVPELALAYYRLTQEPPSRERQVRLLLSMDREDEAETLAVDMISSSRNPSEKTFALDFLNRRKVRINRSTTLKMQKSPSITIERLAGIKVEALAIAHFKAEGFEAIHAENFIWKNLFGLLFWDELFDQSRNQFHHPLQRASEDILHDFYNNHELRLRRKMKTLNSRKKLLAYLKKNLEKKWGLANPLVYWYDELMDHLTPLVSALKPIQLAAVMLEMAKNLKTNATGFPDLFIWSTKEYYLYEIKSPNDHLSAQQLFWINFMQSKGIKAEVLKIGYRQEQIGEENKI